MVIIQAPIGRIVSPTCPSEIAPDQLLLLECLRGGGLGRKLDLVTN